MEHLRNLFSIDFIDNSAAFSYVLFYSLQLHQGYNTLNKLDLGNLRDYFNVLLLSSDRDNHNIY